MSYFIINSLDTEKLPPNFQSAILQLADGAFIFFDFEKLSIKKIWLYLIT